MAGRRGIIEPRANEQGPQRIRALAAQARLSDGESLEIRTDARIRELL